MSNGTSEFPSDRKSRPPPYGSVPTATAAFQDDGRLQVSFDSMLPKQLPESYSTPVQEIGIDQHAFLDAPPMHINIMIVGSRGTRFVLFTLNLQINYYWQVTSNLILLSVRSSRSMDTLFVLRPMLHSANSLRMLACVSSILEGTRTS